MTALFAIILGTGAGMASSINSTNTENTEKLREEIKSMRDDLIDEAQRRSWVSPAAERRYQEEYNDRCWMEDPCKQAQIRLTSLKNAWTPELSGRSAEYCQKMIAEGTQEINEMALRYMRQNPERFGEL